MSCWIVTTDSELTLEEVREAAHQRWEIENNVFKRISHLAGTKRFYFKDPRQFFNLLHIFLAAVAVLARFVWARSGARGAAARAAAEAVARGHPVVVIHVLNRAAEDIETRGPRADWYTPVLLDLIRSVPARQARPRWEHRAAMNGLKRLLAGPKRRCRRAVAGGLLATDNRAAALLAKPLLDSPYDELATMAALVLGRFAEPAAAKRLGAIVRHPHRHRPQIVTMACWYLLKIHKQTGRCVEQLVRLVK